MFLFPCTSESQHILTLKQQRGTGEFLRPCPSLRHSLQQQARSSLEQKHMAQEVASWDFPLMIQLNLTVQIGSYSKNIKPLLISSIKDDNGFSLLLITSIQIVCFHWLPPYRVKRSESALQFVKSKWSWHKARGMLELQNFSLQRKKPQTPNSCIELKLMNCYKFKYKCEPFKETQRTNHATG